MRLKSCKCFEKHYNANIDSIVFNSNVISKVIAVLIDTKYITTDQ